MYVFLKKEWLLAIRQLHTVLQPLFFVLMLVVVFPLAIGVDEKLLRQVAPGIIWVAVLLSVLLASEKYYKSDFEDGSLEQLILSGRSVWECVLAKAVVQWIIQIVPIILALPLFALFYNMPFGVEIQLAITLIIGSPTLLLLAMLGSVVTLSVARGGMLLILLILPLYIPTLVFALSAISSYSDGFSNTGQLAILGALCMITLIVVPFAIVATIKVSLSDS